MLITPIYYPLTHPQKGIWYTEKFYPGTGIANVIGTMRLKQNLDFGILEQAINYAIKHNEGLRLRILEDTLGPKQYVAQHHDRTLEIIDFSNQGGWQGFLNWVNQESQIPFNVIDSDLFQFTLFKIGEGDGGFYLKTHHTISDAWSMILIGNQINNYYFKIQDGIEITDPHLPSYLDYIELERLFEQSAEFRKNRDFWNDQFETLPELTTLRPRKTAFSSCEARRKSFILSQELTKKINQYTEELGISVFVLILSALGIYLHRVLDREDIIIGTPLLNRPTFKEKTTIGMFIETIPVRLGVNESIAFETFTLQVAEKWRKLRQHRYPYNLLLEDIRRKHRLTSNLYDIMLSYQNARFDLGLSFETNYFPSGSDSNSLLIHVSDRDNTGQLNVDIDYQTALFDEKDIDYLYNHLFALLNDALKMPSKKLHELDLFLPGEKAFILQNLNNTEKEYPHDKTIHQLFEEQVARTPDKVAVVFDDEQLTYEQLNQLANRYARLLRQQGVGPESIVGLMADRSLDMIVGLLAILKAGGAYLPLDPHHPEERINYTLQNSGTNLVVTQPQFISQLKDYETVILGNIDHLPIDSTNLENVNAAHDLAYVLYTSGSTGKPKGVMVEHQSVANFFTAMNQEINLDDKIVLSVTTICFDIFVFETLLPLVKGLAVIIANEEQQLVPEELRKLIVKHSINVIQTTPSRMNMLITDDNFTRDLHTITDIVLGGEPLSEQLVERLHSNTSARIFNGYGPTEATIYSSFKEVTSDTKITIGHPVANTQIYILDKQLNPVPFGVTGEIYISGASVARGYLYRPDLTEERFLPNPFKPEEKMYRTGDLAEWGADGNITFLGRKDYQVKIRGYRIELGEIEHLLLAHPQVFEAVVVDKEDDANTKYLCAYIVADSALTISELRKYLTNYLPDYMIPSYFIFIGEMPINPSGKVDRKALTEMTDNHEYSSSAYTEPRNEVDEVLIQEWQNTLKSDRIGIDDNFFELGGDSLKIVRILVALIPYNWELTARDFYRHQTIRGLSDMIRGVQEEDQWANQQKDLAVVGFKHPQEIKLSGEKVNLGNVLLTGATGYLGAHLLKDFLSYTDANIYCLVRGGSPTEAKLRLSRVLEFYFPSELTNVLNRIHVVPGDITLDNWGLTLREYNDLFEKINTVVHSAAKVRHYGGYDEFEKVNVLGTKSLIDFCTQGNKRFHYISTTSVSGRYLVRQNLGDIVFTENDFYIGQHYHENVYVRSKFEAENLILHNIKRGLNATIYRIGVLAGRYSDGQFQANINDNGLYNRLRSVIQLGFIQEEFLAQELELSPVDYCSRAIVLLTEIKESSQHIFHIFHHDAVHLLQLIEASKKSGFPIEILKAEQFENEIKKIYADPHRKDLLTGIINDLNFSRSIGLQHSPTIDSSITREYLQQLGFEWPEVNFEYLEKVIKYMKSISFIVDIGLLELDFHQ